MMKKAIMIPVSEKVQAGDGVGDAQQVVPQRKLGQGFRAPGKPFERSGAVGVLSCRVYFDSPPVFVSGGARPRYAPPPRTL